MKKRKISFLGILILAFGLLLAGCDLIDLLTGKEAEGGDVWLSSWLSFAYAHDIPPGMVGTSIAAIDVSGSVTGGTAPYTFSASGLPAGIFISPGGVISGTPTAAAPGGSATLTVTDNDFSTASTIINYGAISDILKADIDSSLFGTWRDKATSGSTLTVIFTETTISWGGTEGNSLNSILTPYQNYGSYGSWAWEARYGTINLVYIDPYLGRQSHFCYNYVINGSGELEMKTVGGTTFATLEKDSL
jgi:hypothetical protein